MAVSVQEFVDELRLQLDDVLVPEEEDESARLWTTEELFRYINRAQDALCVYTSYLPNELELLVTAEESFVDYPYFTAQVTDAYLRDAKRGLRIRNRDELGSLPANDYGLTTTGRWRDSIGAPTTAVIDFAPGKILLIPQPQMDDILLLVGSFLPARINDFNGCFFTKRPDHIWALMPHVKMQAYSKHDADSYDPNLSAKYKAEALEAFNRVDHEVKLLRKSPHQGASTISYGGIKF